MFFFLLFFFVTLPLRLLPFVYWRYNINSLLTIGGWWFSFWPAKIHSVISLTLCGLLDSEVIPDTPVKVSNFHEMGSSIHSSVEAKECSPAPWVSFSLSYQNQSLRFFFAFCLSNIHIVWIRIIFWRTVIFWDTSINITWTIRKYLYKILTSSLRISQCIVFENLMFLNRVGTKP